MTTPHESEHAAYWAMQLLEFIAAGKPYSGFDGPLDELDHRKIPVFLRREAIRVLRHFSPPKPS